MLVVVHLWNKDFKPWSFPCGPYVPTLPILLVVATITSLKPTESTYHHSAFPHDVKMEDDVRLDKKAYVNFLANHFIDDNEVGVSLEEHVAFLFYWLCTHVSCCRSIQTSLKFFNPSYLLHIGSPYICLLYLFVYIPRFLKLLMC